MSDYPVHINKAPLRGSACIALVLLLAACAGPQPRRTALPEAPARQTASSLPPQAPSAPAANAASTAPPPAILGSTEQVALPPLIVTREDTPSERRQEGLQKWMDQQRRLYRTSAPLMLRNVELCGQSARKLLGFTAKTMYSYSSALADSARAVGLDERLQIVGVLPQSGAAEAGLRAGDVLLAVEDEALPAGPDAERDAARQIGKHMRGRDALHLRVARGGAERELEVPLTTACAFGVELGSSSLAASYADGYRIMLTQGMLDKFGSDRELSYVLAREMARNLRAGSLYADAGAVIDRLRVPLRPDASGTSGASDAPDAIGVETVRPVSAAPGSFGSEAAIDQLALYLLARAGIDIEAAPAFWLDRAQLQAGAADSDNWERRMAAMRATIRAIAQARAAGAPLLPARATVAGRAPSAAQ